MKRNCCRKCIEKRNWLREKLKQSKEVERETGDEEKLLLKMYRKEKLVERETKAE